MDVSILLKDGKPKKTNQDKFDVIKIKDFEKLSYFDGHSTNTLEKELDFQKINFQVLEHVTYYFYGNNDVTAISGKEIRAIRFLEPKSQ